MKRKRYIILIFIVLIVCVGLKIVHLSENKKGDVDFKDNEYSVDNEKISIDGFTLEMPRITYLKDKSKQQVINEILINNVKEYFSKKGLSSSNGEISMFEYSIETKNDTKLSVLFTYQYYDESIAHPFISAFAINLDLEAKEIINLDDFKDRIKLFDKSTFSHVTKRETSLKNDGRILENKSIEELLQDMDDNSFYFIDNKIGIIFEVPYACGGYSIYEEI